MATAGEGARGIVAGSCGVTSVFRTFIYIGTLVPASGVARQAGAAERAITVADAAGLPSRGAVVAAILAGIGRRGDQDARMLVICKLIATAAFAPVASW